MSYHQRTNNWNFRQTGDLVYSCSIWTCETTISSASKQHNNHLHIMNNLNELRYWKHLGISLIPTHMSHLTHILLASISYRQGVHQLLHMGMLPRWSLVRSSFNALVLVTWGTYMKTHCKGQLQQSPGLLFQKPITWKQWSGQKPFHTWVIPVSGLAIVSHQLHIRRFCLSPQSTNIENVQGTS